MGLESFSVRRRKVNNLHATKYSTAEEQGYDTTRIISAIPSISFDGITKNQASVGNIQSKVVVDGGNIETVQLWVTETVADIIALDDA